MGNVLTPKFRVSYPSVFTPKKNELNGKDEYSVVALFELKADSPEFKALKDAAVEAIEKKWGKDKTKWPANLKTPFRDQGERKKVDPDTGRETIPEGYIPGNIFINFKSTQRPGLIDQTRQDIIDQTQFYPGCFARASVNAYAYDQKGNKGVSFGLQNIQKLADGDPLAGRPKAQDEFEAVDTGATAPVTSANDLFK